MGFVTGDRQEESLKDFAVRVYARDGVASACLDAQDHHGMDVNLVLYACWLSCRDCVLTRELIRVAEATCREHRRRHILPLRARRLQLKGDPGQRHAYETAKARELKAEFQQLGMLEALPQPTIKAGGECLSRNLESVCQHYEVPTSSLHALQVAMR